MIEVKIPADIQAYKSKLIFGLSTRQVISVAAAMAISVPVGVYGKNYISSDILPWIIITISAPIIAWGFFYYKDMFFDDFIRFFISQTFLTQKRVYEDTENNIFYRLNEEINEIEITQQRVNNGELETTQSEWSDNI